MSTAMPVCSVLVAAYNAEQYLAQCLDSLVGQTLADIEVIVVDDGSADRTLQIARRYARADARVKCLALMGNHGQAYARNQALGLASGRYICFLDADDWYAPDAIEQAVSVFSRYPDTDCVLFDVVMILPLMYVCFGRWGITGTGVALLVGSLLDLALLLAYNRWRYGYRPSRSTLLCVGLQLPLVVAAHLLAGVPSPWACWGGGAVLFVLSLACSRWLFVRQRRHQITDGGPRV